MIKAFLSHTSLDKDLVGLVHEKLGANNAWYDSADIENGESIPEKINEGLRNATHYVLFWSERASLSAWVRAELNAAFVRMLDNKCRFLIFCLDDTKLPELLQPYKYGKVDKKDIMSAADTIVDVILSIESGVPNLSDFVNRTKEIGEIEEAVRAGYKLIILHGILGIGKSSLAERALQWLYPNKAARRVVIDFNSIPGIAELSIELCRKAHTPFKNSNSTKEEQKENIRYFLEIISSNHSLLILKDVKEWLNDDGELGPDLHFVTDIIVSTEMFEGITLVTSSRYIEIPYDYYKNTMQIPVDGMDDLHIAQIIHNNLKTSFESDDNKNLEFAKRLHGYPLGAKLGAYNILNHGYSYFLEQPEKIKTLKIGLAKQLISFAGLSRECQKYLQILALCKSKLRNEEYAQAFPEIGERVAQLADEAFFAGVLKFDDDGCYKLEPLVEDYFYDIAFSSDERKMICDKLETYFSCRLSRDESDRYLRLVPTAVRVLVLNNKLTQAKKLRRELTATMCSSMWDQYNHGEYDDALKTADGILADNETAYDALYVKALCLTRFDEYEKADSILDDLLKLDSQDQPRYFYAKGRIRSRKGSYMEAIEYFKMATFKRPRYLSPYREMAECYIHMGRYSEAQTAINEAKKIDESNVFVILQEALLLQKQGTPEKSIELLSDPLFLEQKFAQVKFRIGRGYDQIGEKNKAKECYTDALARDTKMYDAWLCLLNHKITENTPGVEKEISELKLRLRGKRKAILTNIEARYVGYVKGNEQEALDLLQSVKRDFRDKQWYAVKIQMLDKMLDNNSRAGRVMLAEQIRTDLEHTKAEYEDKFGTFTGSDIDFLPDT